MVVEGLVSGDPLGIESCGVCTGEAEVCLLCLQVSSSSSSPTSKFVSTTGNKTFRYEMGKNLSGFTPIMKCLIASFYKSY